MLHCSPSFSKHKLLETQQLPRKIRKAELLRLLNNNFSLSDST